MPTEIIYVDNEFLEKLGVGRITSSALLPDHQILNILCIQPSATIEASTNGFSIIDENFNDKILGFLDFALAEDPDIVCTPEYCVSWGLLNEIFQAGKYPSRKTIWLLGCQSISWNAFQTFKNSFDDITWIVEGGPFAENRFLDPTCYFLHSENSKIAIVQFKNESCGDGGLFLERDNLATGSKLYVLRKDIHSIHLSAISCSDAFSGVWRQTVNSQVNTPYLIFHPQLNDAPRQLTYTNYRREFFRTGNKEKEVFSLNWAQSTRLKLHNSHREFPFNQPYSAIFSQSSELDLKEPRVTDNHRRGLYLSRWEKQHAGIYVFHFDEAIFQFDCTKASQSVAEHERRGKTGPRMASVFHWQDNTHWESIDQLDDGFSNLLAKVEIDGQLFRGWAPLDIERAIYLANALNPTAQKQPWHTIKNIPSFISTEEEVVRRYTFTHDLSPEAVRFRDSALIGLSALFKIVEDQSSIPPSLIELGNDWIIGYVNTKPAFNFCKPNKSSWMLFAYAGQHTSATFAEIKSKLWDVLGEDDKHRLAIWYHEGPLLKYFYRSPDITEDISEQSESIAREKNV